MPTSIFQLLGILPPGERATLAACPAPKSPPASLNTADIARWCEVCQANLNKSKSYAEAAKNWEGAMLVGFEWDPTNQVGIYIDVIRGKCKSVEFIPGIAAYQAKQADANTKIAIFATVQNWYDELVKVKPDLMKALMTRRVQIKGDMKIVMRNSKAAGILGYYLFITVI